MSPKSPLEALDVTTFRGPSGDVPGTSRAGWACASFCWFKETKWCNKNEVVKKVNAIQTTDTSNLVKQTGYNRKINEIEKDIITDHDRSNKYITTKEINKLTVGTFAARLSKANLTSKIDIAAWTKKADFDDKLKHLNNRFTSNRTKNAETEMKRTDLINKVVQISKKRYDFLLVKYILQVMMVIRIFYFLPQFLAS